MVHEADMLAHADDADDAGTTTDNGARWQAIDADTPGVAHTAPADGPDEHEADEDEDAGINLGAVLGISPERQRELAEEALAAPAAANASATMTPEPPTRISPADAVAETNIAVEYAKRRASQWACDLTGAVGPMSPDNRRKLLDFYLDQMDDPDARAVVERIAREDPDLAPIASAALRRAEIA
jgi:hypothetical protein